MLDVTDGMQEELRFWTQSLVTFNGQPILYKPSAVRSFIQMLAMWGMGGECSGAWSTHSHW